MNCGIIGRNPEGRTEYVNHRLLDWLGYEEEDLVGQPAEKIVPTELHDLIREEMKAAREGDMRVRLAILQRKDGTSFPVISVPHRLFDDEENYIGGFAILVDLGAVQTAKPAGYLPGGNLRGTLSQIAMQLQSISLAPNLPVAAPIPLEHPDLQDLSPREIEVLTHLISGDRVPAISAQLHISPHTVRNHLKSIYRKVDVKTQSELIQRVRELSAGHDAVE